MKNSINFWEVENKGNALNGNDLQPNQLINERNKRWHNYIIDAKDL